MTKVILFKPKFERAKNSNVYFYGAGDIQFEIINGLNIKANLYKSRFSNEYSRYDDSRTTVGQGNNGFAQNVIGHGIVT